MPTYLQVTSYIQDVRTATPANPVTATDFADVIQATLDHFTNEGSWDPLNSMNAWATKANLAGDTFTGSIAIPIAGASAANAAKGITFKNAEYILTYADSTAGAGIVGALFSHLDTAAQTFRFGKHTGAALLANGSNFSTQFLINNAGVGHFAARLHINTGTDFTDQTTPLFVNGNARCVGLLTSNRFSGAGTTPAIVAGTGAGTTPTVTIVGSDVAGRITITTGTSPAANAAIVTITFAGGAFPGAPYVALTPSNQLAASLSGAVMPFPTATTTTFVLTSGTTALTAATTYTFNYHIIQ